MSESEYTPNTEQVRRYWQYGANAWSAASADDRDLVGSIGAEFDRWLAAHDAEVKAEAWNEGHNEGWESRHDDATAGFTPSGVHESDAKNPYREEIH